MASPLAMMLGEPPPGGYPLDKPAAKYAADERQDLEHEKRRKEQDDRTPAVERRNRQQPVSHGQVGAALWIFARAPIGKARIAHTPVVADDSGRGKRNIFTTHR